MGERMEGDVASAATVVEHDPPDRSAPVPRPAALAPDELVAGRYRVVRVLASGGMGEVYEVEDVELRERVALKTVLPELARNARAVERLRREAQLARRVTHPNVCRLFDVGNHGDTVFLTMELLDGQTLAERLRAGKMTTAEALPIVRQLAAGLAAIHESGIVHRDFKPANVVLVAGGTSPRAVITDFGIARGDNAVDRFAGSVTISGEFLGSPHYMAPEQVEGLEQIAPAADIYALGVVIYEMVTGTLPFHGASDFATAAKRLTAPPDPPRQRAPELDKRWDAVILTCLERYPSRRFASVGDVVAALDGRAPAKLRRSRGLVVSAIALAAATAAGAGAGVYAHARAHRPAREHVIAAAPAGTRRAVAVLAPQGAAHDEASRWVGLALGELLHAELAAGEQLRVASMDLAARAASDVHLATLATLAALPADGRARLAKMLSSEWLVSGSYQVDGGRVTVELDLVDAATGQAGEPVHASGPIADLGALADELGRELRARFDLPALTAAQRAELEHALVHPAEPLRWYALGLDALRRDDAKAAADDLAQAVAGLPDHALAHAALARAWTALGYEKRAVDEADRAVALASGLSRADRLGIEAGRAIAADDWDHAAQLYGGLWAFFPDDLEWGLALAGAQSRAGRNKDDAATIAALRRMPEPQRDDPRINLADADLAENTGDFKRERDTARATLALLGPGGDYTELIRAHSEQGWALFQLGDVPGGVAQYQACAQLAQANGSHLLYANAQVMIATLERHQGKIDDAARGLDEALGIYEQLGAKSKLFNALNELAILAVGRGDLAGAVPLLERALDATRATDDRVGQAIGLLNIGSILSEQGRLDDAKARTEESLALARAIGDRRVGAMATDQLGLVFELAGDLAEAQRRHEQALDVREQIGDKGGAATSRAALAGLQVDAGHGAAAIAAARAAAQELEAASMFDETTYAYEILARAELQAKDYAAATDAVTRALAAAAKGVDRANGLAARLTAARIRAAQGHPDRAAVEAVRREAEKIGLPPIVLDARLAAAELAHDRRAAAAVAKDAHAAGLELLARRAAALR